MSSKQSSLSSLPVEILHNIFRKMDTTSMTNTRLTCRLLYKIGLDHFGDEIPLVFHRHKFRALTAIAKHPVLSKRMKSLYYAGDLFKREDWYKWDVRRSPEEHYRFAVMEFATESELRLRSRVLNESRLRSQRIMNFPNCTPDDIAPYRRYKQLCADQDMIIEEEKLDISSLSTLFEGCPKLLEITLAFRSDDGGPQRRLKASRTAFADAMTVAHGDCRSYRTGLHHLKVLAEASRQSRRSIDSLTLVNVDYSALYGGDAIEYMYPVHGPNAQSPVFNFFELRALVQPLRRLRLFIQMTCKKYEMRDHPTVPKRSVFTEARGLRVLKIRLQDRRPDHELPPEKINTDRDRVLEVVRMNIDLDFIFLTMHYPHLYELSLANCKVYDSFPEFMLRHRQTLRRVSLNNMMLISWRAEHWSWLDMFSDIAGRLTNLHSVTIRGFFFERDELTMNWHMPPTSEATETTLFCPARDAIENFIIHGGMSPWGQTPDLLDFKNQAGSRSRMDTWHLECLTMIDQLTIRRENMRRTNSIRDLS
jgi:hypothetical protein